MALFQNPLMQRPVVRHFCLLALCSSAFAAGDSSAVVAVDTVRVEAGRADLPSTEFVELGAVVGLSPESSLLSDRFPAFQVNSSGAFSFNDSIALRGLANTPIFGSAAVGVYLEEIPLGGPFTLPEDLSGLESAVLSYGPAQGSAVGRSVAFGVGSQGAFQASMQGAWQKGGDFALTSLSHSRREGYILNAATGNRVDGKDTWSVLVRAGAKPQPKLELSLTALLQRVLNGEQPLVPLFGGPGFEVNRSQEGRIDGRSLNLGLTARYQSPWGQLSFTSSVNDWQLGPYLSVLAFGPAELLNDVALRQRNFNQELRLSSKAEAALRWTAGFFVSDGETEGAFARSFGPMTFEASDYRIDTTQAAAFAELTVALARGLEFGAGLRAEQVSARLLRDGRVPMPARIGRVEESSALLPRASLRWRPRAEASLDVSLVSGYKPGGVSAFTGNEALSGFGAERLTGLELGGQGSLAGGRVKASLRAHAYRLTGYQVERSFATGSEADDYLVVNAPRAASLGLEAGLSCRLAADLRVGATASLNRTTLREFTDPYTHVSHAGKQAPYAPESDAGLSLEYGAARGWFASARVAHKGRVYYTEGEEALFSQASRTLLSARLGHAWERLRVSVHGENLGDRRYWTSIAPGTYHGAPGAPLSWGAEASLSF